MTLSSLVTPPPIHWGRCIVFDRFLCLFVYIFLSFFFFSFFVSKITRKRLGRFAWNFQRRCEVTVGRSGCIFRQFRETARYRDAQHGGRVCCALAPQLVYSWSHTAIDTAVFVARSGGWTPSWPTPDELQKVVGRGRIQPIYQSVIFLTWTITNIYNKNHTNYSYYYFEFYGL